MKNSNLHKAKAEKNDEFYTQIVDIEREINAYVEYNPDVFRSKTILLPCDDPEWSNFTKFFATKFEEYGIKKLISTSYAPESKNYIGLFSCIDDGTDGFDADKSKRCGKIFVLERDVNGDGRINYNDLEWDYLNGNGDFASEEVTKLRDEADFIITNPPFSKFREFMAWIMNAPEKKQFAVIGSMNALQYKEIFPYIASNDVWIGFTGIDHNMIFGIPNNANVRDSSKSVVRKKGYDDTKYTNVAVCWFTNIEHNSRHNPLTLMPMKDNIRFNKKLNGSAYQKYDNYDAIEVPSVSAIPSDYDGIMGVPITFLDKFCPEQFEIIGLSQKYGYGLESTKTYESYKEVRQDVTFTGSKGQKTNGNPMIASKPKTGIYYTDGTNVAYSLYTRIFIRHKNPQKQ